MISKNDITDQFLSYINKLKHRHDLKIVDTHVHPFDVMGIVHYENDRCPPENDYTDDYLRPTLMEKLESGKAANALVKIAHRLFPRAVISEIESLYGKRKGNRVLDEMECALVDSAVLVPVEPWVPLLNPQALFPEKYVSPGVHRHPFIRPACNRKTINSICYRI